MATIGEPRYPFQLSPNLLEEHLDELVLSTVASLSSFYLELPRGPHFLEYEQFQKAYDAVRLATADFTTLDRHVVRQSVEENPLVLVVLRCIVGVSPPELADMASELSGLSVSQGFARAQDQRARQGLSLFTRVSSETVSRLVALIDAACTAIEKGPEHHSTLVIHRLNKADTVGGLVSVQRAALQGVEYSSSNRLP